MNNLNTIGRRFISTLVSVVNKSNTDQEDTSNKKIHATGAGRALTLAYEQLRKAAEYTEEHLLLRRAIQRFYKRIFISRNSGGVFDSGEELIAELTMAGYIKNNTVSVSKVDEINQLASEYYEAYVKYANDDWTLGVLSVEVETLLNNDPKREIYLQFVYDHYIKDIDRNVFPKEDMSNYELALFIAIHKALLKSDDIIIRAALLKRYQQKPSSHSYRETNEMIDSLLDSKIVDKVYHVVDRRGAPFRILWRMIDDDENVISMFKSKECFLSMYEKTIEREYLEIDKKINRGVIKSVIFLIITKALIGVAIEIPYDYLIHGSIIWLALAVNLLLPPVYMVLLRLTLKLPSMSNTSSLVESIDTIMFNKDTHKKVAYVRRRNFSFVFNLVYALFFIIVVGGVLFGLHLLGFSVVHLAIFLIFISTASFLGFRLSRQIRDIEIVDSHQGVVVLLRDFIFMPFVIIGRWISDKYSRVNIIALILDMAIEMPLKTILHLIRQWGLFISSKKDAL